MIYSLYGRRCGLISDFTSDGIALNIKENILFRVSLKSPVYYRLHTVGAMGRKSALAQSSARLLELRRYIK